MLGLRIAGGMGRRGYTAYSSDYLHLMARQIRENAVLGQKDWCIFDNTALREATQDALGLLQRLVQEPPRPVGQP